MIYAFGLIAVLVLLLVYVIAKKQQVEVTKRELENQVRRNNRHISQLTNNTTLLIATTQNNLIKQLHSAYKSGLVKESHSTILKAVFLEFRNIVNLCLQEGMTLEEALLSVFSDKELNVADIKELIKAYPQDVRIAWSKNTAEGFILSMTKLGETLIPNSTDLT